MSANRLDRLDSWRAICCLGVLWIHCWHLNASLPIVILGLNIVKPFSILGNGVDFFFVISGFCMYYFYINKINKPSLQVYKDFILSRVYRILPAYLFSLVAYTLILKSEWSYFKMIGLVLANMIFIQNFSPSLEIWSHFWSIAVEWHFYLIFPIILYLNFNKNVFVKYFIVLTSIITLLGIYILSLDKINDLQLPVRFVEFAMGILMAYYYKSKNIQSVNKYFQLIIAFVLLFMGRMLNVDSILNFSNSAILYSIIKVSGYAIMTAGFALLLYLTIDYGSNIFKFLEWKPLVFIGRISYSFYLWHGIVVYYVWYYYTQYNQMLQINLISGWLLQFIISVIITIPIAYLSYYFLEKTIKYKWAESK
jgi:peptidoglycan/LPS O-acetylase OafA/YrhL